ncbi:MAG: hypothetical protein HUK02_09045 [Bacteroidaceae bacterium]|nr:hypothetical protein [Bacteroidaceae bacterium]
MSSSRRSPWGWLPSLFGAEEIPATIITYVALLMFLQKNTPPSVATGYCGLLFLPWVLKSFLRDYIRRAGRFRRQLQWSELLIVLALVYVAYTFQLYSRFNQWLFMGLFAVSLLTAWHELAARMYYERMLYPDEQRHYNSVKAFFSLVAVVLTYGFLIIGVGAFEVYYRRIPISWQVGVSLVAGTFLLFAFYHILVLRQPLVGDAHHHATARESVRAEVRVLERIKHKPHIGLAVAGLLLLLLPQSLMFYSRVIFLLAPRVDGGLGCTMQEVGFAQGTVGVIAFTVGLTIGRRLISWLEWRQILWWLVVPLGLSPFFYLLMTIEPPTSLFLLCMATFQSQLCFGVGLPVCLLFVRYVSGERYRNTINYLYIPLVACVMLVPMAASGWLVEQLGFRQFFMLDVATSLLSWGFIFLFRHETIRLGSHPLLR